MLNEFISFWFETRVEGELKYETILDVLKCEWCTCKPNENSILLRGTWKPGIPDNKIVDFVSPFVESAIRDGLI
jgi:hypothetical protein